MSLSWRAHECFHKTGSCGCTCLEAESAKLHFNWLLNNKMRRSVPFISSQTAMNRRHCLFASASVSALSPRWSFCYYILDLFLWAARLFIRLTAACPDACQLHHPARYFYFSPTRAHSSRMCTTVSLFIYIFICFALTNSLFDVEAAGTPRLRANMLVMDRQVSLKKKTPNWMRFCLIVNWILLLCILKTPFSSEQ